MPARSVDAVLFDYGRTLVTFEYPSAELTAVIERFRPRIAAAAGAPAPDAAAIVRDVLAPLEEMADNPALDEVSYPEVFAAAWQRAGLELPPELLYEILDAEQLVWDRTALLDPGAREVLAWLGAHGCRRAVCSNAPFPAAMMRRQVDFNGIGALVDSAVFSSEVGRRKPAPEIYMAALGELGVEPSHALFVGDRFREDYEGPVAIGMRAVIYTAHAVEPPPDGVPTIGSLRDLAGIL